MGWAYHSQPLVYTPRNRPVPVTSRPPLLRRLALALAFAQLAAFAVAPVLEGVIASRGAAVLGPTAGTAPAGVVVTHNPADCAACSLLHAKALTANAGASPLAVAVPARFSPRGSFTRPTHAAISSVLSRAPPVAIA
jgi:hypothetical protein